MKTKKQEELTNSFLSQFEDDIKPLYHELIMYLSVLGYNPKREGSKISFKHDLHNKQMAKLGVKSSKKAGVVPLFSLRFSACHGYSQRFNDIVSSYIVKYPTRAARCISDGCSFCSGTPSERVYKYSFPNGEIKTHCGAYAIEIPDITAEDIDELKKLIKEEHDYLMQHEAN